MRARYLTVGTLLTALALFVWQSLSNAAIPWHEASMQTFANDSAAMQAIRDVAPTNGLHFSPRGLVMVTSFTPTLADQSQNMAAQLGRQVVLDLVAAFVLALVVARLAAAPPLRTGLLLGLAGLGAGIISRMSDWNWYAFPPSWELVNTVDLGLNLFLAGLVLAWCARRFGDRPAASSHDDAGVRADGGFSPVGSRRPSNVG